MNIRNILTKVNYGNEPQSDKKKIATGTSVTDITFKEYNTATLQHIIPSSSVRSAFQNQETPQPVNYKINCEGSKINFQALANKKMSPCDIEIGRTHRLINFN